MRTSEFVASGKVRFASGFETFANAQLKQELHGSAIDTSRTAAERYPDTQTIPPSLKDSNHYWTFFGARPEGSFFVATGPKFWKPGLAARRFDPDRNNPYVLNPKKP